MTKFKVAHIVLTLKYGGLEKLVLDLCRRLQARGMDAPIICLTDGGELVAEARSSGIPVHVLGKKGEGFDIGTLWQLIQIIRRENPRLVHTHNFAPLVYGTLAATLSAIPCLNTRHGRAAVGTKDFIWRWNRHVAAVSQDARAELLKANRIDADKVSVVYNGIDTLRYTRIARPELAALRRELGLTDKTRIIGTVARLAPEKDQATLLQAFARLLSLGTDACLLIVGDGPNRGELERLSAKLGISARAKFLGFHADTVRLYSLLDVFVLSSLMEGVSLTLLEAMACGCPVVATKVGGNPEVVVDGVTGLLVPPGQPELMAEAVEKILSSPAQAVDMAQAGRRRVEKIFDLEEMVASYINLYDYSSI